MAPPPTRHSSLVTRHSWYRNYVQTYLERDVRQLVSVRNLEMFERFLVLLAGRVGSLVNASSLAGEVGASATTVQGWISILEASFVVFRLQPWHEKVARRMVRTPKLYFTEPGLAAALLGIETAVTSDE